MTEARAGRVQGEMRSQAGWRPCARIVRARARRSRKQQLPGVIHGAKLLLRKRRIGDLNPGGWLHPTALAVRITITWC